MQNYTTIIGLIRLRESGASMRACQSRFRIGSSTCQLILKRYAELSLPLSSLEQLSPQKVEELFYPPENIRRNPTPLPDFEKIYSLLQESHRKNNLFFQWTKYKADNPDGYQYSQFVEYFNRHMEEHHAAKRVSMAVERIPGEKVYIDWVGDKPEIIYNPADGTYSAVHIFVTTVGVSNYLYAELFPNEKIPYFVAGTVHALEHYGAVPKYLVPDNAATAVTKHTKDELLINSTYEDLESFYNTIVLPPPPYKPKGKATVEKHVQILETWLIEELKNHIFTSFEEANIAVKRIIADINDKIPAGAALSRKQMFERYDKPQMTALSDGSFTLCDYVPFNRVPDNYHLFYDGHYYSVLYTYHNKPVILKATMTEIRVCDQYNRLICTHERSYKQFPKYITKDEHMSPTHRYYKEVNMHDGDYYRRWASSIGQDMSQLIERILRASQHEEQAYNSCNGILHMCDGKSAVLCNAAARKCIELNSCKYSYFKKILTEVLNNGTNGHDSLPEHRNIRGKDYYK